MGQIGVNAGLFPREPQIEFGFLIKSLAVPVSVARTCSPHANDSNRGTGPLSLSERLKNRRWLINSFGYSSYSNSFIYALLSD